MKLLEEFEIGVATNAEAFIARSTLIALGYELTQKFMDAPLENLCDSFSYTVIRKYARRPDVVRAYFPSGIRELYTLKEFVEAHIVPEKTPAQIELEKLEAQAEALKQQIATLKSTIQ